MVDSEWVHFKINGQMIEVLVPPQMLLIDFLRKEVHLTSVKKGCDRGHCGTCTVIISGKSVRSCLVKMAQLDGCEVETIESLQCDGKLHILQAAFIQEAATQCGYCTPGLILAAKALLDKNPSPTETEIKHALKHNLCRCTGYNSIINAVNRAAEVLQMGIEYVDLPLSI